ncbi:MAG: sulfate ABC transporter permease subunit CysW, partial [Acetobacter peroxydans]|nr:sulfate ABC transporter permease subunit CysW [Acetobacter peroxydans]
MMRYGLWVATWLFILVVLVAPPAMVLSEALKDGLGAALATLSDPDGQSAIWLTLRVTVVSVAINTLFGVLAAWLLACFRFRGRQALLVLLELPLSISPVVSGLVWLLLFGAQGWFGPLLERWNIHIAFAVPGIILATLFVTLPYVVRTLLPVMELQGRHAE